MSSQETHCAIRALRHNRRSAAAVLLAALLSPVGAAAQAPKVRIEVAVLDPSSALTQLASADPEIRRGGVRVVHAAFFRDQYDAGSGALRVGNYELYSDSERELLLDGLVGIAAGRGYGTHPANEAAAVTALAVLNGLAFDPLTAPAAAEVPTKVLQVFDEGTTKAKHLALLSLGNLLHLRPPQTAQILALLESVATGPEEASVRPEAAISALRNACQFGLPTMRRIHAQRLARDPDVARDLDWWAENGFRVGRATPGPPCS